MGGVGKDGFKERSPNVEVQISEKCNMGCRKIHEKGLPSKGGRTGQSSVSFLKERGFFKYTI